MEVESINCGIKRPRTTNPENLSPDRDELEICSDNLDYYNNLPEPIPEDYKIENLQPGDEIINFINNHLAHNGHSCGILRDKLAWCGREKCVFKN